MSTEIDLNNCFVISPFNYIERKLSSLTFAVEVMFNLRTFSQVLATVIEIV